MKRGTPDHPKTHDLAAALSIPRWGAVGILESLWHFTANYAPRGDLGRRSDEAIARAIGWDGEPSVLIKALCSSGWLDRCACHRLRVHDWKSHADQTVQRREDVKKQGFIECYDNPSVLLAVDEDLASQPLPLPLPLPKPTPKPKPLALATKADALSPFPSQQVADAYLKHYPQGTVPGAMFKALRPLVLKHGWKTVEPELDAYLQATEVSFHSWPKFAAGFGSWATRREVESLSWP